MRQVLALAQAPDPGVGEAALLLVRQLCARTRNAASFLSRDSMHRALHVLEESKMAHLHEVAAQVVAKVTCIMY